MNCVSDSNNGKIRLIQGFTTNLTLTPFRVRSAATKEPLDCFFGDIVFPSQSR